MSNNTPLAIQPIIISVSELLQTPNLCIPAYQRPYKWSSKNVHQLLDDILMFKDKPAYRLGTVVYHREGENLNIVDGQQRTLTFMLIALAIEAEKELFDKVKKVYPKVPPVINLTNSFKFDNPITKNNLRKNYQEIVHRVKDFTTETVLFFYQKCEVVKVVLTDISEAFQFFDSQNARGVDLAPHDLLKAFHLREMQNLVTETEQTQIVANWEDIKQGELKSVFAYHLYRIRNWSNGKSARRFTKNDVHVFKGISPNIKESYPFAKMHRINHFYVEGYNQNNDRNIDQNYMVYPFQLDQVIINGKRFFEMINHYNILIKEIQAEIKPSGIAKEIIITLNDYPAKDRTGDKYVYNLFKCALIFYIDKFGKVELDRAIEKIFVWAYKVRLEHKNVQLATMDNYAIAYPQVFKRIKEALKPSDFLSIRIESLNSNVVNKINDAKVVPLKDLFKKLKYLHV